MSFLWKEKAIFSCLLTAHRVTSSSVQLLSIIHFLFTSSIFMRPSPSLFARSSYTAVYVCVYNHCTFSWTLKLWTDHNVTRTYTFVDLTVWTARTGLLCDRYVCHIVDRTGIPSSDSSTSVCSVRTIGSKLDTPNVKKRHRRAKSSGPKSGQDPSQADDSDGYEFIIVSLDTKQWHFEAQSHEEREEWVSAVEQQILQSLQANLSGKTKSRSNTLTDPGIVNEIRNIRGNQVCCDCDSTNPDWASINLGALICIECSGIHRNLGSHISRVRSLDLDDWPPELVAVMKCIGNILANSVWEKNLRGRPKPSINSTRDEKEAFIRGKYERKEFLPPLPYPDNPIGQQLIDSIVRDDIRNVLILLAYASPDHVNAPYSKQDARTALHIAAALGNFVYVQLLLWYNADVAVEDHDGRNALFYARTSEVPECIELLKNSGCPESSGPTLPRRRSQQHAMLPQQYLSLKPGHGAQPVPVAPPRVPQTPTSGCTTPQQTHGSVY